MEGSKVRKRTPGASLKQVFLRASEDLPREEKERAEVVAEALGFLQRGFEAHYGGTSDGGASDEEVLVGDGDYARAVETIARLDEPPFVAVASRMIRDGAGSIASGRDVTFDFWTPHLAELLAAITGEEPELSIQRIRAASKAAA